jgi:DNA-directed RNA polymerase subunit H (RpoH/RPB5)
MIDSSNVEYYVDIKRTQLEMVVDRGYIIPTYEQNITDTQNNFINYVNYAENPEDKNYWINKGLDPKDVIKEFFEKLKTLEKGNKKTTSYLPWQLYWDVDRTKALLFYHIHADKTVSVDFVKQFLINFMELISKSLSNIKISCVLISNVELSPEARKSLKLLPTCRFFLEEQLIYNPVKNVTNQEHILLTPNEVSKLEEELKLNKNKFPGIKLDNAVVQYYGWEQGDVIKIIRTSRHVHMLAKKSINYRVVIV